MAVRIKYIKNQNGTYVTDNVYKINGKEYRGHIVTATRAFISCLNNGQRINLEADNIYNLKEEVKCCLKRLGVVFEKETRNTNKED